MKELPTIQKLIGVLIEMGHPETASIEAMSFEILRNRVLVTAIQTDERGEFFWCMQTKVRPRVPAERPKEVIISDERWEGI